MCITHKMVRTKLTELVDNDQAKDKGIRARTSNWPLGMLRGVTTNENEINRELGKMNTDVAKFQKL